MSVFVVYSETDLSCTKQGTTSVDGLSTHSSTPPLPAIYAPRVTLQQSGKDAYLHDNVLCHTEIVAEAEYLHNLENSKSQYSGLKRAHRYPTRLKSKVHVRKTHQRPDRQSDDYRPSRQL